MKEILEFYRYHINKYGKEDIRAMGWHDEEEYSVRFGICAQVGDLNGASILDVGCGFGGFYKYLVSERTKDVTYLGIDIVPEMVKIAKENNPTGKFQVGNLLKKDFGKFDYIFGIGCLNIATKDPDKYFFGMIGKMIAIAKKAVCICFLSSDTHLVKGVYHFENVERVKKYVEDNFNVKIQIVADRKLKGESCIFIKKL